MKIQNWKRSSAIALSAFLFFGITEGTSYASSVTASAQMEWASLKIEGTGATIVYNPTTWTSSWSRAGTFAQWTIPSNVYGVNNFQTGIVATIAESEIGASLPHSAYALAKTDTVSGKENIIAAASAFATNYEEYSAIATAQRDQYYQVTGNGNLIFSINYTLGNITIDASDGSGWADILSFSYLTRFNAITKEWDNITGFVIDEIETGLIDYNDVFDSRSGTLTFTYDATEDEFLHFGAGVKVKASAASAVPVPGAVWLLGSGLLGMIAIRRKSAQ